MNRIFFFTLLMLLALPAACSSEPSRQTLTAADAGKTVELKNGEQFSVVLAGNPTTGYTWQNAADSTTLVELVGEIDFKADSSAIGAGGRQTLTFKAATHGEGALKLEYRQPWDLETPAESLFEVQVVVR